MFLKFMARDDRPDNDPSKGYELLEAHSVSFNTNVYPPSALVKLVPDGTVYEYPVHGTVYSIVDGKTISSFKPTGVVPALDAQMDLETFVTKQNFCQNQAVIVYKGSQAEVDKTLEELLRNIFENHVKEMSELYDEYGRDDFGKWVAYGSNHEDRRQVEFRFNEKYGRPIFMTLNEAGRLGNDDFVFDLLVFEPDVTKTVAIRAMYLKNCRVYSLAMPGMRRNTLEGMAKLAETCVTLECDMLRDESAMQAANAILGKVMGRDNDVVSHELVNKIEREEKPNIGERLLAQYNAYQGPMAYNNKYRSRIKETGALFTYHNGDTFVPMPIVSPSLINGVWNRYRVKERDVVLNMGNGTKMHYDLFNLPSNGELILIITKRIQTNVSGQSTGLREIVLEGYLDLGNAIFHLLFELDLDNDEIMLKKIIPMKEWGDVLLHEDIQYVHPADPLFAEVFPTLFSNPV